MDLIFGLYHLRCPQSLANRCETQYFDAVKRKMSFRNVSQNLRCINIFLQENDAKMSIFLPPFDMLFCKFCCQFSWNFSSNFMKTRVLPFFVFSSLAALISICGLSDPVKSLIESFVGDRRFHFVQFPIIEKNGIGKI